MTELTTNGRAVRQALLVIADIRGYTPFMKAHWTSLAHAQDVVARLLEAVIDGKYVQQTRDAAGEKPVAATTAPRGAAGD